MKTYRLFALFGFAALAFGGIPAAGQVGLGVDVSPAKIEISMPPGSSYPLPITVHNSTFSSTHIQASLVDFGVSSDGNYLIQKVGTRADSLMRYAAINPREFDLPAQTSQRVRFSITLPDSDLSGEYAGIVFFQTRPVRRAGAVAFSARVATKVYVTVPGTVRIDGAITKMSAYSGALGETYRIGFKNLGNAHVYLRGQVDVRASGVPVDRIAMPNDMLVERGGQRLIEISGKTLPPGKYEAVATIDYGGKAMTGGEITFDKE